HPPTPREQRPDRILEGGALPEPRDPPRGLAAQPFPLLAFRWVEPVPGEDLLPDPLRGGEEPGGERGELDERDVARTGRGGRGVDGLRDPLAERVAGDPVRR